jgi:hypothetical protein
VRYVGKYGTRFGRITRISGTTVALRTRTPDAKLRPTSKKAWRGFSDRCDIRSLLRNGRVVVGRRGRTQTVNEFLTAAMSGPTKETDMAKKNSGSKAKRTPKAKAPKQRIKVVSGETATAIASVPKSVGPREPKAPATPRVASKPAPADLGPKKLSGLDAAAQVLAKAQKPLGAKEIAERAIALGWKTEGKTPEATLYAAMIREISAKGPQSRFKRSGKGEFVAGAGGGE